MSKLLRCSLIAAVTLCGCGPLSQRNGSPPQTNTVTTTALTATAPDQMTTEGPTSLTPDRPFDRNLPDREPTKLWTNTIPCRRGDGPNSGECSMAVIGDRVFLLATVSEAGAAEGKQLIAYQAATGERLWSRPVANQISNDPRANAVMWISTVGNLLSARTTFGTEVIDPQTGATLWKNADLSPTSFDVSPETVLAEGRNTTSLLSRASGEVNWVAKGQPIAQCAGLLVLVEGGPEWSTSVMRVVDSATGVEKWSLTGAEVTQAEGRQVNLWAGYHQCTDDTVWTKSDDPNVDNTLRAFDLQTGTMRWSLAFDKRGTFEATADRVMVVTDTNTIGLSALDGHEIWRRQGRVGFAVAGHDQLDGFYENVEDHQLFHIDISTGTIVDVRLVNTSTSRQFNGFVRSNGVTLSDGDRALVWASDRPSDLGLSAVEITDRATITNIWTTNLGDSYDSFEVGGGRIFVRSGDQLEAYG